MITNVIPRQITTSFPYPGAAIPLSQQARFQLPSMTAAAATPAPPSEEDKMIWGEPTWFLLHALAEKIKPADFENNATTRQDVLNIIYTICTNLPCPSCSEHAKTYLTQTAGYTSIRTKDELKNMLFAFHNYVNSRKRYPIFSRDVLDEKYSRANIKNIIYNFLKYYPEGSKNPNMISNELFRSRIIAQLIEWFKTNIHLFDGGFSSP